MATLITKNSSTASAVPAAGDLVKGELAVNVTDKKVYTKDNSAAVVKLVGSLGNQEASAVAITGGTINGTTIGATTPSTGAFTTASASSGFTGNLTGNVTGNVSGTAANVTGVVAIANGGTGLSSLGTGVQTALGQNVTGSGGIVLATSPSLTTPNLGTPSAAVLTNATGLPLTTGVTGTLGVANGGTGITAFGTGVATALGQNVTGSGGIVLATSPSLTTPNLGTPSAATLTNATGLPLSTGVTGTLATTNGGTGLTSFTANGVVYASSTSALTTGSALSFDGSTLNVNQAFNVTDGTDTLRSVVSGGTAFFGSSTNVPVVFRINSTEAMRLTSTSLYTASGINVGIGTSSPGQRLSVNSGASTTVAGFTSTGSAAYLALANSGATTFIGNDSTSGSFIIQTPSGGFSTKLTLDNSGNLGLGTSSPANKLHVQTSTTGDGIGARISTSDASGVGSQAINLGGYLGGNQGVALKAHYNYGATNATSMSFWTTNAAGTQNEGMHLDSSGNLGIGVTPSGYLANKFVINTGTDSNNGITIASATNRNGSIWFADGTTGNQAYRGGVDYQHTNDTLYLYSGGQGNFQLTAAGNLGLGVTPSAWDTGNSVRALQLTQGAVWGYGSANMYLAANNYWNGTNRIYLSDNTAGEYRITGNVHAWMQAASGTAGNDISFTQAMTLDASGDVVIGDTATNAIRLSIAKNNPTRGILAHVYNLGSSGQTGAQIQFTQSNIANWVIGQPAGEDAFAFWSGRNTATNGTERARIDSSGNLLVGTTSAAQGADVGNKFIGTGAVWVVNAATNDAFSYYNTSAAAYRFYVSAGGTISATNTTISAISDQRFKENIRDLDVGLDKIMALKPRKFDWKAGKGKDKKDDRGFIAQEFEQVFPDLIDEWKDPAPEGEEPYKSVRQDLIPVLVKAIQEQQAIITDLRARVAQLEAK